MWLSKLYRQNGLAVLAFIKCNGSVLSLTVQRYVCAHHQEKRNQQKKNQLKSFVTHILPVTITVT